MIDIYDLYKAFLSRVNSYVGGWFRPQTDFETQCNIVSMEFWEKYTRQAEKAQEIRDDLRQFLVSKNIITKAANSYYATFSAPDNYARFASARLIKVGQNTVPAPDVDNGSCVNGELKTQEEINEEYYDTITEVRIENIDNQRWSSVLEHLTKKPTLDAPKLTQIDNGFKVAPRQVSVVVLDYYIKPEPCKFVYTITPGNLQTGEGDELVYNKNQSKGLPWPPTMMGQFVDRLEEIYIQFTRDPALAQLSTLNKD